MSGGQTGGSGGTADHEGVICVVGALRRLEVSAGFAWLGSVGLVVIRATEAAGSWATTAAAVIGAAASTLTVAAIFLATLPGMLATWHEGIEYGRRMERQERGLREVPHPARRHLTTVR